MAILFNPAFLEPAERGRRFAGRAHDLAELLRVLRENRGRSHNQHVMVLGPRGRGKTALLLRTLDLLRQDGELAAAWLPLVAPEELYLAGSPGELWLELVRLLTPATGDPRHLRAHEELRAERDERRLAARALAYLLDFADRQQRRLLLVLENLQLLFGEQMDAQEAWGFREVLLHEPRIMVLGSALASFPGLRRPDAALYELFLLHPLEPLDLDATKALWRAAEGPESTQRQLRVFRLLAGGSPRLLATLADLAAPVPLPAALAALLDAHTDSCRLILETLPSLERKVFATLALAWDEAPAARVAEEARLEVNVASAQLARLESRGFALSRRQGRGKVYRPADPLFALYLLHRRGGPGLARLQRLLLFMDLWAAPGTSDPGTLAGFEARVAAGTLDGGTIAEALRLAGEGSARRVLDVLAASPMAVLAEPLLLALRRHLALEGPGTSFLHACAGELLQDLEALGS